MNKLINRPLHNFKVILSNIVIHFPKFDLNRCDERTFYIQIELKYEQYHTVCDLIYLIDKEELYGAISLNELYGNAQKFFLTCFDYELLYTDEMQIAKIVSQTVDFQKCLKAYSEKYPKFVQPTFFK